MITFLSFEFHGYCRQKLPDPLWQRLRERAGNTGQSQARPTDIYGKASKRDDPYEKCPGTGPRPGNEIGKQTPQLRRIIGLPEKEDNTAIYVPWNPYKPERQFLGQKKSGGG
jgi:hypothetical protein